MKLNEQCIAFLTCCRARRFPDKGFCFGDGDSTFSPSGVVEKSEGAVLTSRVEDHAVGVIGDRADAEETLVQPDALEH